MTIWEYLLEKTEFLQSEHGIHLSVHIENGRVELKARKYHPSGQMLYCTKDYSLLQLSEAYAEVFDLGLATMIADVLRAYEQKDRLYAGAPHYMVPA